VIEGSTPRVAVHESGRRYSNRDPRLGKVRGSASVDPAPPPCHPVHRISTWSAQFAGVERTLLHTARLD
jgi:hypothetical protein